ncbi:MAG: PAS domain-containing protein, partial [bacterium]
MNEKKNNPHQQDKHTQYNSPLAPHQVSKHDVSLYIDLFNSAPDGFLISDAEGVIQVANPTAVRLLSSDLASLLGKSIGDFVKDKNQWQEYLAILSGQKEMQGSNPWEVQLKPSKSAPFWASITSGITYSESGNIAGFHWLIRDISESKQVEDAQLFLLKSGWSTMGEDFFASLARYLSKELEMDYVCIDRLDGDKLTAHTVAIFYDGRYEPNESYTLKDTPCGAVVGKT